MTISVFRGCVSFINGKAHCTNLYVSLLQPCGSCVHRELAHNPKPSRSSVHCLFMNDNKGIPVHPHR